MSFTDTAGAARTDVEVALRASQTQTQAARVEAERQRNVNIEGLLLAVQHELPEAGRVGQVPTMLQFMQAAIERFGRTIEHLTDILRLQKEYEQPVTQLHLARVVQEVQLDLAPFSYCLMPVRLARVQFLLHL